MRLFSLFVFLLTISHVIYAERFLRKKIVKRGEKSRKSTSSDSSPENDRKSKWVYSVILALIFFGKFKQPHFRRIILSIIYYFGFQDRQFNQSDSFSNNQSQNNNTTKYRHYRHSNSCWKASSTLSKGIRRSVRNSICEIGWSNVCFFFNYQEEKFISLSTQIKLIFIHSMSSSPLC